MNDNQRRAATEWKSVQTDWFHELPTLLTRLNFSMSVYDIQSRAELRQWTPGSSLEGKLVWQHNAPLPAGEGEAVSLALGYLDTTIDYLSKRGWPGVVL